MKFWQAMKLVDEGWQVRRKSHFSGFVEMFHDAHDNFVSQVFAPDNINIYIPAPMAMTATDWEVYDPCTCKRQGWSTEVAGVCCTCEKHRQVD